ncbi:MAG: zinc ribbon domain-containing protein [Planctomycetota bacterium]
MPTYEYACESCGHQFEEFQSMSAKPLRKCPECGELKLKRLIGIGAGVIFKGSGFYETDYRSEGYKKDEKAETEAAKPKKDGDAKSGDSSKSSTTTNTKKAETSPKASDKSGSDKPKGATKAKGGD